MPTLETPVTEAATLKLEQTRVIRATRSRVYEAWTNPEILKQWFGPAKMHCPSATMDVRVGGSYRIDVVPDVPPPSPAPVSGQRSTECAERRSAALGTYTKVVPNELLQFTWAPDWNPGEQSLVTVSLKDVAGGTEITIRHENFATESSRDGHNNGWVGCLDKLADKLEA
jgi:uncharacterized protein YndB with AHSA1/START domain